MHGLKNKTDHEKYSIPANGVALFQSYKAEPFISIFL
jgi:hypothetical protein